MASLTTTTTPLYAPLTSTYINLDSIDMCVHEGDTKAVQYYFTPATTYYNNNEISTQMPSSTMSKYNAIINQVFRSTFHIYDDGDETIFKSQAGDITIFGYSKYDDNDDNKYYSVYGIISHNIDDIILIGSAMGQPFILTKDAALYITDELGPDVGVRDCTISNHIFNLYNMFCRCHVKDAM